MLPAYNGCFLLDKPAGWTSHTAVAVLRKRLSFKKIGHTGTLDPAATGLLVLLAGNAAKSQSRFQNCPKTYRGVIRMGIETDTWDAEGRVISSRPVPEIPRERIAGIIERFTGNIMQEVPPFSAVRYQGRRLYKMARNREAVPLIRREVEIISWKSFDWNRPEISFELECSGGTYVRSIAYEIGKILGCGGHLKHLRRLKVADWRVENAMPGERLEKAGLEEIRSRIFALPA